MGPPPPTIGTLHAGSRHLVGIRAGGVRGALRELVEIGGEEVADPPDANGGRPQIGAGTSDDGAAHQLACPRGNSPRQSIWCAKSVLAQSRNI